jgi:hypothetical protein
MSVIDIHYGACAPEKIIGAYAHIGNYGGDGCSIGRSNPAHIKDKKFHL